MKIVKSYRLSPRTIQLLNELKKILLDWTETDIVEAAIDEYFHGLKGAAENEKI